MLVHIPNWVSYLYHSPAVAKGRGADRLRRVNCQVNYSLC